MTKAEKTRLENLRAKKADGKYTLTRLDLHFLKKLTEQERQESKRKPPPAP